MKRFIKIFPFVWVLGEKSFIKEGMIVFLIKNKL